MKCWSHAVTSTAIKELCTRVTQMPRSPDLAIFVLTTETAIAIALPLAAHARAGSLNIIFPSPEYDSTHAARPTLRSEAVRRCRVHLVWLKFEASKRVTIEVESRSQTPSLRLRRRQRCGLQTVHALCWRPQPYYAPWEHESYWGCGQAFMINHVPQYNYSAILSVISLCRKCEESMKLHTASHCINETMHDILRKRIPSRIGVCGLRDPAPQNLQ